jgi:G3E family GTPase
MTKIDILSGFLGAGKTTLIKKLIDQAFSGEKLVLIENEFGEIGIDGGFLKEAGVEITEMNSGCICCSLVGDFGEALKKVIDQFSPDRVIIEPSGVGKLSDVMKAVEDVKAHADVVINSATTVVDVQKCKMYMKNFGEFFNNQVESAGTIVLSRTQNVDEKKINDTLALLREHNKDCAIITTPWDDIDGKIILDAMEHSNTLEAFIESLEHDEHEHHHHHDHDHGHEHHHHHHHGDGHDADEVFGNIGIETAQRYEQDEIRGILGKLGDEEEYGRVLRAKGILQDAAGSWFQFDYVPGEIDMRDGSADYTGRLCVIGADLNEEALKELFHL